MTAYYNEIDPFAAAWLRELIKAGHIAPGIVDERSIEDVKPDELKGYTQCHFFAGIGVWSYALRQAGWPDDRPVWTGSCPCQPFSAAGKGNGFDDERHLWPAFYWLIQQCAPSVVFGEQVASKATGPWFDLVQADLEGMGYAFGCVAFPAASVGAPHIRDRAYWVADTESQRRDRGEDTARQTGRTGAQASIGASGVGNSESCGREEEQLRVTPGLPKNGTAKTSWDGCEWLPCRDGKSRPVEPGTFPLANGAAARVGRLRGYGNAIVAQQAEAFIKAYRES